jgi:hypothetical protein
MLAHDQMPIEAEAKALFGSLTDVTKHKTSKEFVGNIQLWESFVAGIDGTAFTVSMIPGSGRNRPVPFCNREGPPSNLST